MNRKKIYRIIILLLVIVVIFVPIPRTEAKGGARTYQSLTYKIVSYQKDGSKESKIFLFPNNFKSAEDLLRSEGIDMGVEQQEDPEQDPKETEKETVECLEEQLKELGKIKEGEVGVIQQIPIDGFRGKVYPCNSGSQESTEAILIKTSEDLKGLIGDSEHLSGIKVQGGEAFFNYADTLKDDFFENRALAVMYYSSKNGVAPKIGGILDVNGTLYIGAMVGKAPEGETDLKGCILAVEIDKQFMENIRNCKFMIMPEVDRPGKKPLGGR